MKKLKLNIYRFVGDVITTEIAMKVDDNDLLRLLKTLSANRDEMLELGSAVGMFNQSLEETKEKIKHIKALPISKKDIQQQTSSEKSKEKIKPLAAISRVKDINFNSVGVSSVKQVQDRLQGIVTVIENLRRQGDLVDLSKLEQQLTKIGVFQTLPATLQNTIKELSKLDVATKEGDKELDQYTSSLKQTIINLDKLTESSKKNTSENNNNKNSMKDLKNMTTALNTSFVGLLTIFNSVRMAIKGIWSTMTKVVKDSSDYIESINLFNMALGNYARGLESWANEISTKLYLDPSEIYQYAGSFYNLAKGLGVAGENAAFMAKNLTQLTFDMTSYLNISNDVAYNKLMSAMSGQTKAVTNVGIAVQKASLEQLAYAMGIEKSVTEMTQAEKTYLRYIQIMKSTQQMQGDLGRTIITPTNAMRLFETQVKLTGRAIGQVLTPIIMKVLPYLIALTQLLQEAAQRLAASLGFNLKDYEVDASGISDLFSDIADGADEADDATGKLNRTLAKFDDLNVVESASSGKGGVDVSEADFSKYLRGYDMLKDYTSQMATKIEEAKKQLSGLFDIIKKVATVIATIWAVSKVAKFFSVISKIVTAFLKIATVLKGIKTAGGLKKIFDATALGKYVTAVGGLLKFFEGISLALAGLIVYVDGFKRMGDTLSNWYSAASDASTNIQQLTLSIGELTGGLLAAAAGAGLLFGPAGAIGVGIIGGLVAVVSTVISMNKAMKEMEYQQALLLTEFANTGPTLDQVNEAFKMTFGAFSDYLSDTQALMDELNNSKETLDTTSKSFDNLAFHIAFGDYEGKINEAYTAIEDNLSSLNEATTTYYTNQKNFQLNEIEQLAKDGAMTKETYEKKKKAIEEYYEMLSGRTAQYNAEYANLLQRLADGSIKQGEFNKELADLNNRYSDVAKSTDGATYSFESYTKALTEGVNIAGQTAEQIQTSVGDLTAEYEKQRDAITTNYDTMRRHNTEEIADVKEKMKAYKEKSAEWIDANNHLKELEDTQKTLYANHQADLLKLQSTYATTMESIYNTMEKAGISTKEKFKDVADDIKNKQAEAFTYISDHLSDYQKINTESGVQIGYAIGDGMAIGWVNGEKKIFEKVDKTNDDIQWEIKDAFKIHSPSKVTQEYGENITEGLANGISDSYVMKKVDDACRSLVDSVTKSLGRLQTNTKLEINADIGSSFNNVLNKLDTFCSHWRDAINQLAKNMTTTMNGIKIDGNGKVSYTTMPKVNVKKFENGGYPKSADMFFMNENGRAEYMTSIGNKTAVVNQDQMTNALADTITRAIGSIPTGGTGDVVVYIGNEKVYQGQGEYQSRQSDRYGTTYVKI